MDEKETVEGERKARSRNAEGRKKERIKKKKKKEKRSAGEKIIEKWEKMEIER